MNKIKCGQGLRVVGRRRGLESPRHHFWPQKIDKKHWIVWQCTLNTRAHAHTHTLFLVWGSCCLQEDQNVLGQLAQAGLGAHAPPEKNWKTGAKSCKFMHSGSRNRVIAAWFAHKSTPKIQKQKKIARLSGPLWPGGRVLPNPPPPPPNPFGMALLQLVNFFAQREVSLLSFCRHKRLTEALPSWRRWWYVPDIISYVQLRFKQVRAPFW